MSKFIEEILKNETFLDVIYNFASFYKGSDYEQNMSNFYNNSDKKVRFISKNTEWILITDDGDCYGILNRFVVKVNSEGEFSYVCHGFENLVKMLLSDNLNLLNAEYYCKNKKITLEKILKEYQRICNKYSIQQNLIINEQEFEDYLTNNGV